MITVGIQTVAGEHEGYGHIIRCLELARLLEDLGAKVSFRGNEEALKLALAAGFSYVPTHDAAMDIWIVDLPGGISLGLAERLAHLSTVLVSLQGRGSVDFDTARGRFLCDLVFFQGVVACPHLIRWDNGDTMWYEGVDWLILRDEIRGLRDRKYRVPGRVVVCGGGSDPEDVTGVIINALRYLNIGVLAIVGPGNKRSYSDILPEHSIARNPVNSLDLFSTASVAVVSFGMTAFECLSLGIPVACLSITNDHANSAELVQRKSGGALVHLGRVGAVEHEDIAMAVDGLLGQERELSWKAQNYIKPGGGAMVANRIIHTLHVNRIWDGSASDPTAETGPGLNG